MPTDKRTLNILAAFVLITGAFGSRPLLSATIEVESDDDEAVSTPTAIPSSIATTSVVKKLLTPTVPPKPEPTMTPFPSPVVKSPEATPAVTPEDEKPLDQEKTQAPSGKDRVRISDKVNFFNFVAAGFLAADPAQVHGIGSIVQTGELENYTLAQRPAIEIDSERYPVKKGDLFIVYRCEKELQEPHSGFLGYQVENLALVEVVEVQKTRHLVQVKKSFRPFVPGDRVIPYESEVRRWKQAQVKKPLPNHPILSYIAVLDSPRTQYMTTDPILLTAGSKKGVVEGQKFELFRVRGGEFEKEDLGLPIGSARVLYAGPDYSIATILKCSEPIQPGFKADYRP